VLTGFNGSKPLNKTVKLRSRYTFRLVVAHNTDVSLPDGIKAIWQNMISNDKHAVCCSTHRLLTGTDADLPTIDIYTKIAGIRQPDVVEGETAYVECLYENNNPYKGIGFNLFNGTDYFTYSPVGMS
jgi:hypothetical protein